MNFTTTYRLNRTRPCEKKAFKKMLRIYLLIIILLWHFSNEMAAKKTLNVELYNLSCSYYTELVKQFSCDFRKLATGIFALNANLVLNRSLAKNAEVAITIAVNLPGQTKKIQVLDVKLKVCDILSNMGKVPMIKKHFNELMRSSTLPILCPIKGNVLYKINNYTITNDFFPNYTPVMNFNYTVDFYESNNRLVCKYFLAGATVARN
ncbi:uncharacterized protein LOC131997680 [Stomoxys calcitrans]|uniref:uncharacterized protein LOC131997680 n=1 Tax=Stomoxys calcitrans TaxID=35570 RepID=UPI0027E2F3F2|nr:uncharacterized protein LOC131997680 [Stomoxys calcitrans]